MRGLQHEEGTANGSRILAIDPGTTESAFVVLSGGVPAACGKTANENIFGLLREHRTILCAIEVVASYGMAVGKEIFETCYWIGRYEQEWRSLTGAYPTRVYRRDVKLFLCQSARATDSNIRAALIDMYGPGKEKAIGSKRQQGPLYALKGDMWSALAVALTAQEQVRKESNGNAA